MQLKRNDSSAGGVMSSMRNPALLVLHRPQADEVPALAIARDLVSMPRKGVSLARPE
jgi:hypothetical protein